MTPARRANARSAGARVAASAAALGLLLAGGRARAEADSFGIGSGRTGDVTVNAAGPVNAYAQVTSIDGNRTGLTVDTNAGFAAGDLVLVWQVAGYSPASASGNGANTDISLASTGQWEFGRVLSTSGGNLITLTSSLLNVYVVASTQVVRIPEYRNLTVNAQVSATPWNGQKGGILAFLASGAVTVNAGGSLSANAAGFRGGPSVANGNANCGTPGSNDGAPNAGFAHKGEGIDIFTANGYSTNPALTTAGGQGNHRNGAGGGHCTAGGGGGGGNAGAGGVGGHANDQQSGDKGGFGGATLSYSLVSRMTLGGGAGAGHSTTVQQPGGAGGGVIFLRAGTLTVNTGGLITARGGSPANPSPATNGASGGGAGGSVVIRLAGAASCTPSPAINVSGGTGASNPGADRYGPGGGGGGGRSMLQATSSSCVASVAGGANGTQNDTSPACSTTAYCSTPGAAGAVEAPPGGGFAGVCNMQDGSCGGCFADADCTGSVRGPYCAAGKRTCGSCRNDADCAGNTPACNTSVQNNACAACQNDFGAGPLACPTSSLPICLASGGCDECRDYTHCTGFATRPVCYANNKCGACDGDNGDAVPHPCPTVTNPYCDVGGGCRRCTGNGDCVSRPGRPICNVTTGLCGTACFSDTDCTSAHFCPASGSTCTPKAPNGQLVPASAGVCNAVAGLRTCVSGVCEATDNLCGLRKGSLCASAAECRIGICSATDGRCGVPDGEGCADPTVCRSGFCKAGKCSVCARDADCGSVASGLVCDESTFTCVSGCRRSVGNGCPAGLACTSLDASIGQCVAIADAGAGAGDAAADATLDAAVVDAASTDAPAIVDAGGDAEPEAGPVGAESPFDTGFMAGHGLSCASAPAGGAGGSLAVLGLAAAFAAGVARRRRG